MKTVKKILHVIRPAEGGMKRHLIDLSIGLRRKGYWIEVACPGSTSLAKELKMAGFKVYDIDLVGALNLKKDIKCVLELLDIFRRNNYDLLHFHGSKAGLVGRIAAWFGGFTNIVFTAHNFIIYDEVPYTKKLLFKSAEKLLSRQTAKIITVSESLKNQLTTAYNISEDKIVPIYNGIEIDKYRYRHDRDIMLKKYGLESSKPIVGTVARMAPQKGLKYLIEAASTVSAVEDVQFIIAGDGPLKPELEKFAEELGIDRIVKFPGFINDITEVFSCLDVFVIPSVSEGLSITTIEAMAFGLPVIASRVGGLPELVREGETGYLVEPRNPDKLAECIIALIRDKELRRFYGRQGRAYVLDRFSSAAMVNETCKIYEGIR